MFCRTFLVGMLMLLWVCLFSVLNAPTAQALAPHSRSDDIIIVDENPIGDLDDFLHLVERSSAEMAGRKLLHGCHKKR